ncbi:hypothetical protein D1831_11315 [Lactiplantibacillus garii]|uniref:Integral membrane protein n=1 Tax=Lactiplantibacillus garii TaxID=2306423 RepID=A0A3R8KH39_9LACO|nr:hypothetical protein [Lactiplantibacillus garii]RRK09685.1 hypothetical protein D1831_11315 [Lactiplantibacillus garii]
MYKTLVTNFIRVTLLTTLWVLLLVTLFMGNQLLSVGTVWRFFGIGGVMGLVMGCGYPVLWNVVTWPAPVTVVIATGLNVLAGYLVTALFSNDWLYQLVPFWWEVALITLIGHTLFFYVYQKWQSQKMARRLNQLSAQRHNQRD